MSIAPFWSSACIYGGVTKKDTSIFIAKNAIVICLGFFEYVQSVSVVVVVISKLDFE